MEVLNEMRDLCPHAEPEESMMRIGAAESWGRWFNRRSRIEREHQQWPLKNVGLSVFFYFYFFG